MILKRYVHTIKYLQWRQVYYRLYYFLKSPTLKVSHTDALRPCLWAWSAPQWMPSPLLKTFVFDYLGESGDIRDLNIWNASNHSKLWRYHLHYCDALNALGADPSVLRDYLQLWLVNNPPMRGHAWDPYPISLRVVNWIKWFSRTGLAPDQVYLDSLTVQADVLMQRIEYHILGNHLFANGKALLFLGAYFSGTKAARWLQKGLSILDQEMKVQFLADGGHFELSPMYHAGLLWDLCDLLNLAKQSQHSLLLARVTLWTETLQRGLMWLTQMVHPDGDISFFNDAAWGMAPRLEHIETYAAQLEITVLRSTAKPFSARLLKDSGYCAVYLPQNCKAILDVGQIGPDYQPGHAHADTLSFELSLYGQRVLVNSGISQYGNDKTRWAQRATRAHNTVCVGGQNSTDVWSGFRVAQRAYPRDRRLFESTELIRMECAHDGYVRLPGRHVHHRTWSFTQKSLVVEDSVSGTAIDAEARFYLHPSVSILKITQQGIQCRLVNYQTLLIECTHADDIMVFPSLWHPYFGVSIPNYCLSLRFKQSLLSTSLTWD